jgi:hypothetical protein
MENKEPIYEYKKIRSKGAYLYLIRINGEEYWKLHRYDGPAIKISNKNSELKEGYYLHGIPYTKSIFSDLMKQREGIPFYKTSKNKVRT